MAFKKSSGFKSYGKKKSKWKKASPAAKVVVSKLSESAPYPRTLEAWLLRDDKLLADGITAGCDLADLSAMLDREPVAVLNRLNEVDLFPFEPFSEEQIELYSLALSGVPVLETLHWCAATDERLTWAELDALRKLPDPKAGIEAAIDNRLWRLTADDLDDIYWLGEQDAGAVSDAVAKLLEKFDAPTPRSVRNLMTGNTVPLFDATFWTTVERRQAAKATASTLELALARAPAPSHPKLTSRGRYTKRTRSASLARGAPVRDTRSAADRAWESKTHW